MGFYTVATEKGNHWIQADSPESAAITAAQVDGLKAEDAYFLENGRRLNDPWSVYRLLPCDLTVLVRDTLA